ncbi:MAG TPA: hypothetical protein DEG32_09295, partial [Balneolaceae bacterium]|nr:hypothetical protein [Balneolaceae bacterium]
MAKKEQNKPRSFSNDLDRHPNAENDPDFDLDEYINQKSQNEELFAAEPEEEDRSQFKNAILIFIVFAASFLWFNNWSGSEAWTFIFGGDDNTTQVATAPPVSDRLEVQMPEIPTIPAVPDLPTLPGVDVPSSAGLDMPITEYLTILRDKGYLGDEVSSFSARQLYDGNVPISYLDQLQNAGFLEDLSFVYIINYYQNQIPLSYLESLQEAGVYEELSFVDVTNFYQNDVSTDYLIKLNEAGYLEDLSFVYVTNFYQNGVT